MSEEASAGQIIIEAMKSDDMNDEEVKKALDMTLKGHDVVFKFLSEDEDDDSLHVMISWLPIPEDARGKADESLYGHWRDVLKAKGEI